MDVPSGYCQCGCGERTRIAPRTDHQKGWTKGVPLRFLKGHTFNASMRTWKPFDNHGKGEKSPSWKGGRYVHNAGYVLVYMPEHPAAMRSYVLEHRLVVEQRLGRYLTPDEIVHHINENKQDNRDENLAVMTRKEHVQLHGPSPAASAALARGRSVRLERLAEKK